MSVGYVDFSIDTAFEPPLDHINRHLAKSKNIGRVLNIETIGSPAIRVRVWFTRKTAPVDILGLDTPAISVDSKRETDNKTDTKTRAQ